VIGLDTNVLVRYIMQDDVQQSLLASQLMESLTAAEPGFVSMVSVIELGWVLSGPFNLNREQLAQAIEALLHTKEVIVDRAETVWQALRLFQAGQGDFADCLIERLSAAAGCRQTMTFDRGAVKHAGMLLIE
jgi:predicted nucleic-acid-binding protein